MASPHTPKHFLIVGGSLTSLFIAITHSNHSPNNHITILERSRSSSLSSQGAGIALAPIIPPIVAYLKNLGVTSGAPLVDFFERYDKTGTRMFGVGDGYVPFLPCVHYHMAFESLKLSPLF